MIICPSCAHANPDGAVNCEACFTALPIVSIMQCPSCQSDVRSDAKFCGHCGFNLSDTSGQELNKTANEGLEIFSESSNNLPAEVFTSPTESVAVFSINTISSNAMPNTLPDETSSDDSGLVINSISEFPTIPKFTDIEKILAEESSESSLNTPINNIFEPELGNEGSNQKAVPSNAKTQLQQFAASLLHVQTNLNIEIPAHLTVVHIGKPNTVIPPDIDVSGFPDSDIVSRIHADIRTEGGSFYFEDTGSSNGTYINNLPLSAGNRHKLRAGDRISLGKGDKVSFIFQLNA